MLALAKPKMENGDWDSGNEDEEDIDELDEPKPRNHHLDILKNSTDLDLSGSFSARDRRREKQVCTTTTIYVVI